MNNASVVSTAGATTPTMKVGRTTYDVYVHFSPTSKETLTDKVMRLIGNDIRAKKL
jgi:hypothetical protein